MGKGTRMACHRRPTSRSVDRAKALFAWRDSILRRLGSIVAVAATAVLAAACGGGENNDVPMEPTSLGEAGPAASAAPIAGSRGVGNEPDWLPLRANGHFGVGSIVTTPITATPTVVTTEPQAADVAPLAGGGYVIATRAGVHTFDATGNRLGDSLVSLPPIPYLAGWGRPPYYEPVVSMLYQSTREAAVASAAASYVAAWTGYSRYRYDEFHKLYVSQAGAPLAFVADDAALPDIAATGAGSFMVVWQSASPNPTYQDVFARLFAGSSVSAVMRVNAVAVGSQSQPKVAGLGDGNYVVAWTSAGQDGSGQGIYGQRFDGSGNRLGTETRVNTTTEGDQSGPAITALNDGGWLVTWTSPDGDGTGIYGQRFDSGGIAVGVEARINTTTAGDQRSASPMPLGDGGYVVRWLSSGSGAVHSKYFTADGSPDGAEASSSPGATTFGAAAMAGLTDSRFVIVWSGDRVYAQLFEDALVGTEGRDRLAANHRIHLLRGLGGDDRLDGSAGSDTLDGGAGDDFMAGGAGDDTYIVDSGKDKILEHPGEGRDTARSSISHALAHEVEDLVLTGSAAIDGTGNRKDNVIVGNAANNRLSGGAGNDTLDGAGGHDTFVFDAKLAADNVDLLKNFVAAEDTIELDARIFKTLPRGSLSGAALAIGSAATSSSHRILFDPVTEALMYDPDGTGNEAAVRFATMEGLVGTLSAGNFVVD